MRSLRLSLLLAALCSVALPATVTPIRVPNEGIQPQVVEQDGVVHLLYFAGAPEHGDLFYVKSRDFGQTFSKPLRVNSTPGSAIAVGNIRGAHLAVGPNGRAHVAWNGSAAAPTPMLYTRLNDAGTSFEPERNLIQSAYGLDGGGALAADAKGNVYVFWHAPEPGKKGEENRRVWLAKSADNGKTFAREVPAFSTATGACGCCGMAAYADPAGNVYALYRAATNMVNRDIWLLTSTDAGHSFHGADISKWNIGACVMSSESFSPSANGILAAWETEKQAYFGRIKAGTDTISTPTSAPGTPANRKHPIAVENNRGETLFVWTEGMAWKKPGALEWQLYDKDNHPIGPTKRTENTVPVWSLVAAFAKPDGSFAIVY